MGRCSVFKCKSDSKRKISDISFHSFIRKKWIETIGRTNWTPKKSFKICSKHFAQNMLFKKKKMTFLLPNAVPLLLKMMQSKMPNNQYVISLDSLDLNFLRQYVQTPTEKRRLLYSREFMDGNSAYYQVHLMSEELRDEDYCLDDYEIYLCYICNMEVPQTCYNKHVMSNTHQNHIKLAEKVLENVTKQIKVNVNIASNKEKQSYYCETCSKLVSMKHQRQHNLSNNHLKFIEKEKLTQNFVEMYIKSTGHVDLNSYTEKPSDRTFLKLNTISNSNCQYEDDSENDKENEKSKSIAPIIPINHIPDNDAYVLNSFNSDDVFISTSSTSNKQFQSEEETIINFQSYLKEMITKYKLNFKLPIMENTYIVINTPKGYKELITIDSFHGYEKFEDFVFCQLCQMPIEQNMKQHSTSERHVKNITQPVNDNFARAVINNQTVLLNKHLTHCLLCNMVVQGTSKHEHSNPSHKKYSDTNALHTEILSTSKITYCDLCHIHTDSVNLTCHIKGKKHQKNLKANTTSSESNKTLNAIEKQNIPTNSASKVSLVETNKKETFCKICNRYIDTHNFKAHVKAKKHKDNLKKINIPDTATTKANTIPEAQQPQQTLTIKNVSIKLNYCEICKVPVPNGGMSIHDLGKPHAKNMLQASKLNATNAMTTSDQNKLVTTSVSVPQDFQNKRKRKRPNKKKTE